MKSKLHRHFIGLAICAFILGTLGSSAQLANSQFLSYAERKARESETQGNFHYGVVTDAVTVDATGGQKLPLQQGFVFKVVSEAFDNRPDSVVGYIAVKGRSVAFSLPRKAISVIRKNSPEWKQAEVQHQQAVDTLEAALQQAAAPAPQQALPTLPQQTLSTLTKNDRTRMLYVLREEKYISSIRAGEAMSDEQITQLYTKALEQRRLRGIESAIQGLRR